MLSWRAARGDEKLAGGRHCRGEGDEDGCLAVWAEHVTRPAPGNRHRHLQSEPQHALSFTRRPPPLPSPAPPGSPMLVLELHNSHPASSLSSCVVTGADHSHNLAITQHRPRSQHHHHHHHRHQLRNAPHPHLQVYPSPQLCCSSPVEKSGPMVALECQVPVSGRLSPPPADLHGTRSMSGTPYLSPAICTGGGGGGGCADCRVLNGTESETVPASVCPSMTFAPQPPSHLHLSRPGFKRRLTRREDAVCEEEEEVDVLDLPVHSKVRGDTCSLHGADSDSGQSEAKRRRLGEEEKESVERKEEDLEHVMVVVVDEGVVESVTEVSGSEQEMSEQHVKGVMDHSVDIVSSDHLPAAVEGEAVATLDVMIQESADSVVEVDVVGDDGDTTPCTTAPSPQLLKDCYADTTGEPAAEKEHGSGGEEASSEEGDEDIFLTTQRPPRISPFLNTPKQRKEERRKILKLSIHKMRAVEDPEHFLRRSVLINNTMKRLQRELREEKMRNNPRRSCYGLYRRASSLHYDVLNNSHLLHDEPFAVSENDRITDDMTDALVTRLEATSSPVVPTPSPSPGPAQQLDTSSTTFPSSSSPQETPTSSVPWSSDVTSPSSYVSDPDVMLAPSSSLSSEELTQPIPPPAFQLASLTTPTSCAADLTSSVTSSLSSSSSASLAAAASSSLYEGVLSMSGMGRDAQSHTASCSSQSQREKQLYADIDSVFNNLIHALGDS